MGDGVLQRRTALSLTLALEKCFDLVATDVAQLTGDLIVSQRREELSRGTVMSHNR